MMEMNRQIQRSRWIVARNHAALAIALVASAPAAAQTQVYVGACWAEVLPAKYFDMSMDEQNRIVRVAVYTRFFSFSPATVLDFMTSDKESSDAFNAYVQRQYRGQTPLLGGCRSQSQESYSADIAKDKAKGNLVRVINWVPSGARARSPDVVEAAPTMPPLRPATPSPAVSKGAVPTQATPTKQAAPAKTQDIFAANWLLARKFNISDKQRFTWFVNRDSTRRNGGRTNIEASFVSEATGRVFIRSYELDCNARTTRSTATRIYDRQGVPTSTTGPQVAVPVAANSGDSAIFNYACFGENAGFWPTVYRDPRAEAANQFRKNPRKSSD